MSGAQRFFCANLHRQQNRKFLGLRVKCAFTFVQFWVSSTDIKPPFSGSCCDTFGQTDDMARLVSLVLFATMRTRRQLF